MPEATNRALHSDEEARAAFLDVQPPHWAARGLAYVLLLVFAAAAVASVVITLPETISGPFALVPVRGTDPVRAPRSGVLSAVRVSEGQAVAKGDPAFAIRSAAIGDRSAELRSLDAQLAGGDEGHANARSKYESQRRADDEEGRRLTRRTAYLSQKLDEQRAVRDVREAKFRADLGIQENEIEIALKEIEFKRKQHALARELADRLEQFHKEGAISWLEFNSRQLEATKLAVELQQLERTLETARLRVNQLKAEYETQAIDWKLTVAELESEGREVRTALEKLRHAAAGRDAEYRELERRLAEDSAKARIRAAALRDELGQSRGSELAIPAPCSGTVLRLMVKGPEAVVQDGEVLGELACSGEQLQAEVSLPQSGIGQIKPGQVVKLLYDAFPYQRYGVKYGRVRWVSPAGVAARDRAVFRVLADIGDGAIMVKGQARPLMPGMTGRADIVVGRRSLLSFAFEPVRQLKESLADGPKK
jgi:membrane fusion protein